MFVMLNSRRYPQTDFDTNFIQHDSQECMATPQHFEQIFTIVKD